MHDDLLRLRDALLDLTAMLNRPQPDAALIAMSGVELDRALFPLLMRLERKGRLGIGELAKLCGRDYTSVSRQIAKLAGLGLVTRRVHEKDARISEAVITTEDRTMTAAIDAARETLMESMFTTWDKKDVANLGRLLRQFGRRRAQVRASGCQ